MRIGRNLSGGTLSLGSDTGPVSVVLLGNSYVYNNVALEYNTSNNLIPTTSWAQTNFGNLNYENVWNINQVFTSYIQTVDIIALYIAPIQLYCNTDSTLDLGNFCSAITIGGNQTTGTISLGTSTTTTTMTGTTNMSGPRNTGTTLLSTDSGTTIPPTSWVQTNFGRLNRTNTWSAAQTFSTPIRTNYAPSTITVNTMIGYAYKASVLNVTITSTRYCQCALNATAGVASVLPAGVYAVSYTAYMNTTTTGWLAGVVVRPTITNNSTSATGGVIDLYGGIIQSSQSTTAPFYITSSTFLTLDGTNCVALGIQSTTTNTSNVDIYMQAIRIA